MYEKEEFNHGIEMYLKSAIPSGILVGLAFSCLDILLFCKTIAKYFYELDTIFKMECQLIVIYSGVFVVLGVIVASSFNIYDRYFNRKRARTDISIDTLFVLYVISAMLVLYVSFHHCHWRSESFSKFISQIPFILIVPFFSYCFLKKKINRFCHNRGLLSIISFSVLLLISTIGLLNYLLLFKLDDSGRLLIRCLFLCLIYLFIVFITARGIFSIKKKNLMIPILAVVLMYSIPMVYSLTLSNGVKYPKITETKDVDKPNILLIVSDALRANALGIYGGQNHTPYIDSLAKEGVYFKNAYSTAPWTMPSMVSIFTSLFPSVLDHGEFYFIDEIHETLPEFFQDQGYLCKALVGNFLLSKQTGIHQGFHEYCILNHHSPGSRVLYSFPIFGEIEYEVRKILGFRFLIDTTELLTREAIEFWKKANESSWFLWIHYMDPHDPYYPPKRYLNLNEGDLGKISFDPYCIAPNEPRYGGPQKRDLRRGIYVRKEERDHIRSLYLAEVRYLDDMIGKLIREMKMIGVYDDTFIVFTSDHGEEFWDHGSFYHGQSLYDELLHVPLILKGPGLPKGEVISKRMSLIDLMPLLMKIRGDGKSERLAESITSLRRDKLTTSRYIFSEKPDLYDKSRTAIRDSEFKLIYSFDSKAMELYNIVNDPSEKQDISESNNEIGKSMLEELEIWKKRNDALKNSLINEGSAESFSKQDALRRLKALGYIQ